MHTESKAAKQLRRDYVIEGILYTLLGLVATFGGTMVFLAGYFINSSVFATNADHIVGYFGMACGTCIVLMCLVFIWTVWQDIRETR